MKTKTDFIFGTIILSLFLTIVSICIYRKYDETQIDDTVRALLIQQGKYERLLDSTAAYIYDKYSEFLPDTYWEGDIYQDIYADSEDAECWK